MRGVVCGKDGLGARQHESGDTHVELGAEHADGLVRDELIVGHLRIVAAHSNGWDGGGSQRSALQSSGLAGKYTIAGLRTESCEALTS